MSEIVFNSPQGESSLKDQVDSFQTTLALLNQKIIILQETLRDKDAEIAGLKQANLQEGPDSRKVKSDETLTIIGAVIKLYQYIFPPGKSDQ